MIRTAGVPLVSNRDKSATVIQGSQSLRSSKGIVSIDRSISPSSLNDDDDDDDDDVIILSRIAVGKLMVQTSSACSPWGLLTLSSIIRCEYCTSFKIASIIKLDLSALQDSASSS